MKNALFRLRPVAAACLALALVSCGGGSSKTAAQNTPASGGSSKTATASTPVGTEPSKTSTQAAPSKDQIHKIKHVVVIMQENRSFDTYFGTFPGADGIPMKDGTPTVCVNNPATGECVKPYHDANDKNVGGPHGESSAKADVDSGKMDGFVAEAEGGKKRCKDPNNPACTGGETTDVMGYHDAREIPNYWAYAQNFVLQDRMFEPNASWSLPSHLFTLSEWSATCSQPGDPMSCVSALDQPVLPPDFRNNLFGKTVERPDSRGPI